MKLTRNFVLPCLAILLALMLCATDVMAQPGGGRGGRQGAGGRQGGPGGGRGGMRGGSQTLLQREDVQKELELTDDQIKEIEELDRGRGAGRGEGREQMRAELEGLSDEERRDRMRKMREERTEKSQQKLEKILLPHQVERLAQLSVQFSSRVGSRALTNGTLAEKLEITDEQKEKITERAEELRKEFNEKIAKLRKEMQDDLLSELTAEQRSQYEEMMGDPFTFELQRGAGRGGAGGNRGGRGGAEGGRRGGRGGEGGARGGRGRGGRIEQERDDF